MKRIFVVIFAIPVFSLCSGQTYVGGHIEGDFNEALSAQLYQRNNYRVVPYSPQPRIPLIIHQIWLGGPLPQPLKILTETWKKNHPEWQYKLWTEKDLKMLHLINQQVFDRSNKPAFKSDVLRLEILYKFGGLYVDTDFRSIKPMDIFHHTSDFYIGALGRTYNGLIGSVPRHPIIRGCIDFIARKYHEGKFIQGIAGQVCLEQAIADFCRQGKTAGVVVYPRIFFYPFPLQYREKYWEHIWSDDYIAKRFFTDETYAVHYNDFSWSSKAKGEKWRQPCKLLNPQVN